MSESNISCAEQACVIQGKRLRLYELSKQPGLPNPFGAEYQKGFSLPRLQRQSLELSPPREDPCILCALLEFDIRSLHLAST